MLPDIVVPYKKVDSDELRYAIRSWEKNLSFGNIFLVGDKPDWMSDKVIHIPTPKYDWAVMGNSFLNQEAKYRAALTDPRLSEKFILMNDDFFVMKKKFDMLSPVHRGPLPKAGTGDTDYRHTLVHTREFLTKNFVMAPKNYDLHLPMIMEKTKRLALSYFMERHFKRGQVYQMRSVYGNIFDVGGRKVEDVKNLPADDWGNQAFLSTDEKTFTGELRDYIRSQFPDKSSYEI